VALGVDNGAALHNGRASASDWVHLTAHMALHVSTRGPVWQVCVQSLARGSSPGNDYCAFHVSMAGDHAGLTFIADCLEEALGSKRFGQRESPVHNRPAGCNGGF
jgi:hypothetical protein